MNCCETGAAGHAGVCSWSPATRLAWNALLAIVDDDDWGRAGQLVVQIAAEHGADGIVEALTRWADAYAEVAGIPEGVESASPLWHDMDTDRRRDVDEVPAEIRWAGQLIAARAARRDDLCDALVGALPVDVGPYVGGVLNICANGILLVRRGERAWLT